jgi:predicted transglutaminase-like cysteine proteinase
MPFVLPSRHGSRAVLLAAVLACAATAPVSASDTSLPPVTTGAVVSSSARPLAAWADFCRRYPGECRVDRGQPSQVALTPQLWELMNSVNRKVNRSIEAVTDQEHWGVADRWDFPSDGMGDCEDFQLLKRKMLADAGLPRRAMLMTVVLDDADEGHAVLTIRTDRGDFVLDNKRDAVLPWSQTGYTYIKRESQNATGWVAIDEGASVLSTAARR